ncbi:hypothetical protein [Natronosalvus amylolyticus]|uniref:hypothetical protein n=1 Tax=Natronosalvus amylolyticus TaxID=2961994 RepID=UPI0020C9D666|nr:hypothetical protein [Natronosalvus amylolyticus]
MQRRTLLAVASGSLLGTAGCTYLDDEPAEPMLDAISVRNRHNEIQEIDVSVVESGETRFSETYTVDPGSEIVEESPVGSSGRYLVRVVATDGEQEIDTTEHVDGDERCVIVRFEIGSSGGFNPPSVIASQEC